MYIHDAPTYTTCCCDAPTCLPTTITTLTSVPRSVLPSPERFHPLISKHIRVGGRVPSIAPQCKGSGSLFSSELYVILQLLLELSQFGGARCQDSLVRLCALRTVVWRICIGISMKE